MTEYPIIFSTDMVKAILEGRKTMTRRVIKPQPEFHTLSNYLGETTILQWKNLPSMNYKDDFLSTCCPYGQVGDRLWVRETFAHIGDELECGLWFAFVEYKADKSQRRIPFAHTIPPQEKWWNTGKPLDFMQPSIHMPRWASRITLEITEVRVERLQEITEKDAIAEGCQLIARTIRPFELKPKPHFTKPERPFTYRDHFVGLWDSLNEKRGFGWSVNPWVWVISFKRVPHRGEGKE